MTLPMTEDLLLIQARNGRTAHAYYCKNTVYLNGSGKRSCGRFLLRAHLNKGGYIEVRCPKCGRMTVIDGEDLQ